MARNKSLILLIVALVAIPIVLIAATVALYFMHAKTPPRYVSTARVLVTGKDVQPANEIQVIRSDDVIAQAMQRGVLEKLPTFRSGPNALKASLKISSIEGTDVIQIECEAADPQDAQSGVSAVTLAYQTYHTRKSEDRNDDLKSFLNQSLNVLRADLSRAESELEELGEAKVVEEGGVEAGYTEAIQQTDIRLIELLARQSTIRKSFDAKPSEKAKLQILQQVLGLESPPDDVEAAIAGLDAKIESMRTNLEELRTKNAVVTGNKAKLLKVERLRKQITRLNELHGAVLQKLKDVSVSQAREGTDITIIAPASIARQVEKPLSKLFN